MKSMLSTIIIGIITFFAPVVPVLLAVGAFIMLDTLTGIFKSAKLNGWSSIRSHKLARLASKNLVYNAAVLSFLIIDAAILNDVLFAAVGVSYALTKVMGIVLCSVELKSIDENFEAIYGVGLWETFGKIIRRAKGIAQGIQEIKKA